MKNKTGTEEWEISAKLQKLEYGTLHSQVQEETPAYSKRPVNSEGKKKLLKRKSALN